MKPDRTHLLRPVIIGPFPAGLWPPAPPPVPPTAGENPLPPGMGMKPAPLGPKPFPLPLGRNPFPPVPPRREPPRAGALSTHSLRCSSVRQGGQRTTHHVSLSQAAQKEGTALPVCYRNQDGNSSFPQCCVISLPLQTAGRSLGCGSCCLRKDTRNNKKECYNLQLFVQLFVETFLLMCWQQHCNSLVSSGVDTENTFHWGCGMLVSEQSWKNNLKTGAF